jgi:hypothetical protein
MKFTIDNNDNRGPQDYTPYLDATALPKITRKLNRAWQLTAALASADTNFVLPASGGRVILQRNDGYKLFTGYLTASPQQQPVGYGQNARAWRCLLLAQDDSWLLERNALAVRPPFAWRSVGDALRTITNDVLPGVLDTSGVQDFAEVYQYATNAQKGWSEHAQELALMVGGSYTVQDGKLTFQPLGQQNFSINENDANFLPDGFLVTNPDLLRNDVTMFGELEPELYVRNYFLGDGLTLNFGLSSEPYAATTTTLFQENYLGPGLTPTLWVLSDPNHTVSVQSGTLQLNGPGTLRFVEQVEQAGGLRLQHGQVSFNAPSQGTVGGIYNGGVGDANCLAGFRVTPNGTNSNLQALVNGAPVGSVITTTPGHLYAFATELLANEAHRVHQGYYSSAHGPYNQRGGDAIGAGVRFVLSVHDVDPNNPGTLAAPATVLYDDVQWNTPSFGTYAVVDGGSLHFDLSFTRATETAAAEVRSMKTGASFRTRLTGALADGGECYVTSSGNLHFYPPYPPDPSEQIVAAYRSSGRAIARVQDTNSISSHQRGADNGQRSCVKRLKLPAAPSAVDCENAALAALDDTTQPAWVGSYDVVSDLLPASEVTPGMLVQVTAPSWQAQFAAWVRQVEVQVLGVDEDRSQYSIQFANYAAELMTLEFNSVLLAEPLATVFTVTGPSSSLYLPSLTAAQVTDIIATEITIDAGTAPPPGGGIEVRRSDGGWGAGSNGNLAGRFATQSFVLPRLSRVQDYYLRQYDTSNPPKYSRYSMLLHIDYPYE